MTKELQICSYRQDIIRYLRKKYPKTRLEDIEDVSQIAIIKAVRSHHQWQGRTTLKAWVTQIAINCYLELYRKSYFTKEEILNSSDTTAFFEKNTEEDFSETICNSHSLKKLYEELVDKIGMNESIDAFYLKVVEDLNYEEIAHQNNISLSAAKSRVHRGKMMLQKKYSEIYSKSQESLV